MRQLVCCTAGEQRARPHLWRAIRYSQCDCALFLSRAWQLWATYKARCTLYAPSPPSHPLRPPSQPMSLCLSAFMCVCAGRAHWPVTFTFISGEAPQKCIAFILGLFRIRAPGGRSGRPGWDSAVCHVYIRKVAVSFFRSVSTLQSRAMRHRGGLSH